MKRHWRWRLMAATTAILVAGYLTRGAWLPGLASWLDVGQPPRPADAVLLLNGNLNTRPFTAAALVQGGWARRVLIAREAASPAVEEGVVLPFHELNRRILLKSGIRDEDIVLLDSQVRSTYDEAVAVARYLDAHPGTRLLVVTDGPHSRRARWILAQVLGDRPGQFSMVSSPSESCLPESWWQNESGATFVLSEYLKLAFYAVRYSYLPYGGMGLAVALYVLYLFWRRGRGRRGAPNADSWKMGESGRTVP